ncbi:MAG: hypothetical protein H6837_13275 [Planctomycetes bacterium]|nr:hypothetical protein [Planctomycetota bacterium]
MRAIRVALGALQRHVDVQLRDQLEVAAVLHFLELVDLELSEIDEPQL